MNPIPNVLTIAGTDPTGGAGVQADLKTFSALGGYGMSVITALVAQNTRGVRGVHAPPASFVDDQLRAVFDDVRVDAVKIGMLGGADVVRTVADALRRYRPPWVVVDPVMVAKSGDRLLDPGAVAVLREELLPLADLVTPNLPEAADLLETAEATDETQMRAQLDALCARYPGVLLKGGHLPGALSPDLARIGAPPEEFRIEAARVETRNDHGTGCTLSAAITALRPQRSSWAETVREAKEYLTLALKAAERLDVGGGHGPQHHFHAWW